MTCKNCNEDERMDLLVYGNHFCEKGGKRIDPATLLFDGKSRWWTK
ncbi:MAG: hypothetical protein Q7R52_00210 [archaeon]|nr:hypothetical protein [archaeon]